MKHTCPTCTTTTNVLHGAKVRCKCGTTSDMDGNVAEPYTMAIKPTQLAPIRKLAGPSDADETGEAVRPPAPVLDSATKAEMYRRAQEFAKKMFNYTTPDEKTVEYTVEDREGVFVIFSKAFPINKDGTGTAINYVAEKNSREEADALVQRLKRL